MKEIEMPAKSVLMGFLLGHGLLLAAQDAESAMLYAPAELKSPPAGDTRQYVESRDQEVRAKLEAINPATGSDGVEVSPCSFTVSGQKRPDLITIPLMVGALPYDDEDFPKELVNRGFDPNDLDILFQLVGERINQSAEWTLTRTYLKQIGFSDLYQMSLEELEAQSDARIQSYYTHLFGNLRKEHNNTAILILNALSPHSRRVLVNYAIERVVKGNGSYRIRLDDCPNRVNWDHSYWVR